MNSSSITKITSWFKFLCKNLHLVGCATVCDKSEVMLISTYLEHKLLLFLKMFLSFNSCYCRIWPRCPYGSSSWKSPMWHYLRQVPLWIQGSHGNNAQWILKNKPKKKIKTFNLQKCKHSTNQQSNSYLFSIKKIQTYGIFWTFLIKPHGSYEINFWLIHIPSSFWISSL